MEKNLPKESINRTRLSQKKVLTNNRIPILFCDGTYLSVREDGHVLICWVTTLPEGRIEQCKIMTTKEHLKKMVNVLCKITDHYPIKEEGKKK